MWSIKSTLPGFPRGPIRPAADDMSEGNVSTGSAISRVEYASAAFLIFLMEIAIALFVRDRWVRPHGGDVLAVMLVYAVLRVTGRLGMIGAAATALAIGVALEIGQALDIIDRIGLGGSAIARIVLGTQFEWWDILAYLAGAVLGALIDQAISGLIRMKA
jgi:hypothetical protein